jgi:hypothetical protein
LTVVSRVNTFLKGSLIFDYLNIFSIELFRRRFPAADSHVIHPL